MNVEINGHLFEVLTSVNGYVTVRNQRLMFCESRDIPYEGWKRIHEDESTIYQELDKLEQELIEITKQLLELEGVTC